MLIYNLAATKNSKIKMFTQNESREKQKSSAKIMLITPELAQKESLNKHWNFNKIFIKSWQGFCDFNEESQASLIPKEVRAECV